MAAGTDVVPYALDAPRSASQVIQVLGNFGPNSAGNLASGTPIQDDTWTVAVNLPGTNQSTTIIADGTTINGVITMFKPGHVYEIILAGMLLGSPSYCNFEWSAVGGTPAPGANDWAWPFGSMPQFTFVGKGGQEYLRLRHEWGQAGTSFGTVPRYMIRELK